MSFQPSDDIIKIIICHLSLFWFGPIEPREYPARIYIITLLQYGGQHVSLKVNIILIHILHYFGQLTVTGHSPLNMSTN